jgi:GNAT superfamily N-acetyltransferase
MPDLTVRAPSDDDQEAILDLVGLGLGSGNVPRTRAFWSWKHLASPFGRSYLLVAESGGRIVGLRAFMRWTWWSSGQPVLAVRAVDTVTHPDWRGRGIFTRLTLDMVERVRSEGVAFVFNTPNQRSRPGYMKMGWHSVGRLTPWVQPRRGLLRRARAGGLEGAFSSAGDLIQDPGFDALLRSATGSGRRLTTRPDAPYLRWRYAEIPGLRYHAAWRADGESSAAIVFRVVDRGRTVELRLCEILATPRRASIRAARRLIDAAARRANAGVVTALAAPGTPERRAVLGRFLPVPRRGPVLTVRPLNPDATPVDPRRSSSWRPVIGSMELF